MGQALRVKKQEAREYSLGKLRKKVILLLASTHLNKKEDTLLPLKPSTSDLPPSLAVQLRALDWSVMEPTTATGTL